MNVMLLTVRSDMGGSSTHIRDLLSCFKGDREVKIFTASPLVAPYGEVFKKLSSGHLCIPYRKFSLFSFFSLLSFVRRNNIELVHSHGRGGGYYSKLLFLFGVKIVHTFHGVHNEKSFSGRIKLLIERLLSRLSHKYICVSSSEKEKAISLGVSSYQNTRIIENGVDISKIEAQLKGLARQSIIKKWGIVNRGILIGTLSRLEDVKDINSLIDKVIGIKDITLLIGGDGPLMPSLQEKVQKASCQEKIIFLGNLENPFELLSIIDIYVSHSKMEGLPYGVLEAMAAKVPVLLSRVVGHVDLVAEGKTGLLFNPTEFDEFQKCLNILKEEENRVNFSNQAYQEVQESFSIEVMKKSILGLYKEIYDPKT